MSASCRTDLYLYKVYTIMKRLVLAIVALLVSFSALAQIPRAEYPRPQFEREAWQNLNGEWTYTLDPVKTGWERGLRNSKGFADKIIVIVRVDKQPALYAVEFLRLEIVVNGEVDFEKAFFIATEELKKAKGYSK